MTLGRWWTSLKRILSGRAAIDRAQPVTKVLPPLELPEIESPTHSSRSPDGKESEYLNRKQIEHDRELRRLQAIVRARAGGPQRDP